jgi:diketogulonate reductase-like aldo/keto reductase
MKYKELSNGNSIPYIGLGTWKLTDRQLLSELIGAAYEKGYRLIDTAAAYSNEIAISKAISENGINREDLFISDKVWNTSRGYEAVRKACQTSLKKLKTDYLDMYLIHWPASMKLYPNWREINADTWRGMESLYEDGIVRNIGVCNFKIHHLEELKKSANIMPVIDQVELHPGMNQNELIEYCSREKIAIEASSPLGNGQILENDVLRKISEAKAVSPAQVALRWEYQKDVITIPKTSDISRLCSNIDIFDFELSDDEMRMIDSIPYCGGIGLDPDEVTEFG